MMQNAVSESSWDAHGVESGPCANFKNKSESGAFSRHREKNHGMDALGRPWNLGGRRKIRYFDARCEIRPHSHSALTFFFVPKYSKLFSSKICKICTRLNLDAMSVPEALTHSIRSLVAPAVFLAYQWHKCEAPLAFTPLMC